MITAERFPNLARLLRGERAISQTAPILLKTVRSTTSHVSTEEAVLRVVRKRRTDLCLASRTQDIVDGLPDLPPDDVRQAVDRLIASGRLRAGIVYPSSLWDTLDKRPPGRTV